MKLFGLKSGFISRVKLHVSEWQESLLTVINIPSVAPISDAVLKSGVTLF